MRQALHDPLSPRLMLPASTVTFSPAASSRHARKERKREKALSEGKMKDAGDEMLLLMLTLSLSPGCEDVVLKRREVKRERVMSLWRDGSDNRMSR